MLLPLDPPPDCEVAEGGLGLIVPAGSPEPPPAPPIMTPEVVGTRDEEVEDCGLEVDVTGDEVDDLVREVLKEEWLRLLILLIDVANVLGRLVADECVDIEVGLMAVLDVLESRVLLPVEVAPDIDGETIDRRQQLPLKFYIDKTHLMN